MKKKPPPEDFDENPEWTEADFARARLATDVHPPHVVAALMKRPRGPQKAPTKTLISLRLDPDLIEHFRATGAGWQGRINDTLRKASGM